MVELASEISRTLSIRGGGIPTDSFDGHRVMVLVSELIFELQAFEEGSQMILISLC